MRLTWVTDVHLNFLPEEARAAFYAQLRDANPDVLLIGGDVGEASSVAPILSEIEAAVPVPIHFVLGNHDFYHGSIAGVRRVITRLCSSSARLHWLPAEDVIALSADTALIGHDSWADGRCGDFLASKVLLNDYVLIEELRGLSPTGRLERLHELGDEAAEFLETRARQAVARWKNIVVLTHVPPFQEACWHEGKISDNGYLPHFACKAVGARLKSVMSEHTDNNMLILCGHTHSAGTVNILDNLIVLTGGAEYYKPAIQRTFEI